MFKITKKLKILLLGSLLVIPQITLAELAVRPMLPTGNLSYLGMSRSPSLADSYFSRMSFGSPYQLDEGGKRVYADYWLIEGNYNIGKPSNKYNMQGNNFGGGFDYKMGLGYVSIGFNQKAYIFESEPFYSRTDGYKVEYDYTNRDIAAQYIHEFTEETTAGLQVISKHIHRTMSESVETGTLSSGNKEESSEGEVSYLVYTLFSRVKLSELFSLGLSYAPSVKQSLEHDNSTKTTFDFGNGTDLNIALGLQTERFALEAAVHHESEQPETSDGRVTGASMFGEFLIGNSFSLLFKIAQNNEDEFEFNGTTYDSYVHESIHYGAKLDTGFATFIGDIRAEVENSEDDSLYRAYLQLSMLFDF
jgi:hypothetical protein